ncbi:MAG: hypothetical protein GXP49_01305 [Deltaproteobacteria bacterium]|nr:hypothetical protein [Deltaproteobacteria bacterium]
MRKGNFLVVVLGMGIIWLLAGCGGDQGQGFSYGGYALEDPDGGFLPDQDLPVLDDNALALDPVQDLAFTADDLEQAEAEKNIPEGEHVYLLRIGWGQFPFNPGLKTPTHWQGLIKARGAKVFIVRTYAYEKHDFVRPCFDRSCIAIDAVTLPHHDGLLVKVVPVPGARDVVPGLAIGFKGLYGRKIELSDIDGLSDVSVVDDLGNKVVLDAVMAPVSCNFGFLRGVWKRVNRRGGAFKGEWINSSGNVDGLMAGIWGIRKNGKRVFFGIYADPDGHHRGLLRGTYSASATMQGKGVFVGRWVDKDGNLGGILRGVYALPEDAVGRGVLRGKWRQACNKDAIQGFCPGLKNPDSNCRNSNAEVCEPKDNPVKCRCKEGPNGKKFCICTDCYKKDISQNEDVTCLEEGTCDDNGDATSNCSCKDADQDPSLVACTCE